MTHCIPCFAADLENAADLNDPGALELFEVQPPCVREPSEDITCRRRPKEAESQGLPDIRKKYSHYLDMDQLNLVDPLNGNIFSLSEAEQRKVWASSFGIESEYVDINVTQHIPVLKDSESDPDESQS